MEISVLESLVAGGMATERLASACDLIECVGDQRQGLDGLFSKAELRYLLER